MSKSAVSKEYSNEKQRLQPGAGGDAAATARRPESGSSGRNKTSNVCQGQKPGDEADFLAVGEPSKLSKVKRAAARLALRISALPKSLNRSRLTQRILPHIRQIISTGTKRRHLSAKLLVPQVRALMRVGGFTETEEIVSRALEKTPGNVYLLEVRALMRVGGFTEAEEIVSRALEKTPGNVYLLDVRAECRAAQGKAVAAAEDWGTVVELIQAQVKGRPLAELYLFGGATLLRLKQVKAAQTFVLDGLHHFPEQPRLYHLLAQSYACQGRRRAALQAWQAALAADPDDTVVCTALLSHLIRWGESTQTVASNRRDSVALVNAWSPTNPVAKVLTAFFDGGPEAAMAAWRKLRQSLCSDNQACVTVLGNIFRILKQIDQPGLIVAIGGEDDLIVRNAHCDSPAVRQAIAVFLRSLLDIHEVTKAGEVMRTSGLLQSEAEQDLLLVAEVMFAEKHFDECLGYARRAVDRFPRSFIAHRLVVRCFAHKRDHPKVEAYLGELEARGILDGAQLGRLAAMSGQVVLADRHFARSLEPENAATLRAYTKFLHHIGRWDRILELAAKYERSFAKNKYLRNILKEINGVSKTLDLGSKPRAGTSNHAIIAIYDELLRQAPRRIKSTGQAPRIALVIGGLGPGGAERQCGVLCQQLARHVRDGRIADVTVFAANLTRSARDSFGLASIEDAGISVVEYYSRTKRLNAQDVVPDEKANDLVGSLQPPSLQQHALQLYQHLKAYDPNIVHAWLGSTIYVAGLASALLPNARLVGRWGSLPPTVQRVSSPLERQRAEALRYACKALTRELPMRFYSNARLAADVHADWIGVPQSDILVVHNGIDFSKFERSDAARQRIRKKLGIASDAVVIGTAIRLGSEKRPFMWLDIADKVAAQRGGAAFVIVGDGPLIEEVRSKASQLAHAKVHIVGRQTNISDWYSAMDVTLMTSSVEGLSNTVIESAYMRLPVVAFDVGGMSEAVIDNETGILLPENDVEGIVRMLVRLIDEPEMRTKMSNAAHRYAAESFQPEKMSNSVLAIYKELLAR